MKEFGSFDLDAYGRLGCRPAMPSFPKLEDVWERLQAAENAIGDFDRVLTHPKFTIKDAQAGIGTGSFASVNRRWQN